MERSVLYSGPNATCFQFLDFTYYHTYLFIAAAQPVGNVTLQVQAQGAPVHPCVGGI